MHSITFHNIGNADCTRIDLENGKKILFDFANRGIPEDDSDLRCNLPEELREDLGDRDYYDVVAFTHLDADHYCGATEFFYFEHIKKYQGDVEGEPRIRMDKMWVPAAVLTESLSEREAKAIQFEARERFKAGAGIRVFSRPARLKDWCRDNGVDLDARKHLITDAGKNALEFSMDDDEVEFFVHSPYAMRQDANSVEDRNGDALVMHATFRCDGVETRLFLGSDAPHMVLTDIVHVTESKGRSERLKWDIFKLPHHCSYTTLGDEKGKDKTVPVPEVARLFEDYGQPDCIVVSTSDTIPAKGDLRDRQTAPNPPHRPAANYYKDDVAGPNMGQFIVTMEHPSAAKPKPLVVEIDSLGATVRKRELVGMASAAAANYTAPRAG